MSMTNVRLISEARRARVQAVLARCYVALAEVDYDLRQWAEGNTREGQPTNPGQG